MYTAISLILFQLEDVAQLSAKERFGLKSFYFFMEGSYGL